MDGFQSMQDTTSLPELNLVDSVTFFKAIVGAEDLFDQLADDGLEDINMEPLNSSDLINIKAMTTINGRPSVTLSPVILSNMSSPLTIRPGANHINNKEKLNLITIKNPLEKS